MTRSNFLSTSWHLISVSVLEQVNLDFYLVLFHCGSLFLHFQPQWSEICSLPHTKKVSKSSPDSGRTRCTLANACPALRLEGFVLVLVFVPRNSALLSSMHVFPFRRQPEAETLRLSQAAELFHATLQGLKSKARQRQKRDVKTTGRNLHCSPNTISKM